MIGSPDISALYLEFTDALTEVLAENSAGPARRGQLARARAAVKKHPDYSEHESVTRHRAPLPYHLDPARRCESGTVNGRRHTGR
jgi:hypothetical protein